MRSTRYRVHSEVTLVARGWVFQVDTVAVPAV
jgi:hypothetical protein